MACTLKSGLKIDGVLRGGEVGVPCLGGGEDFFEGHLKRAFA